MPARFWKFRPFYENTHLDSIITLLGELDPRDPRSQQLRNQIAAWRREPFNPHLLARMRLIAYQKTVVMKYIDNLIRWADQLFRQDTIESINEATLTFVPKLIVVGLCLALFGSAILMLLVDFTQDIFSRIPEITR